MSFIHDLIAPTGRGLLQAGRVGRAAAGPQDVAQAIALGLGVEVVGRGPTALGIRQRRTCFVTRHAPFFARSRYPTAVHHRQEPVAKGSIPKQHDRQAQGGPPHARLFHGSRWTLQFEKAAEHLITVFLPVSTTTERSVTAVPLLNVTSTV